MKLEVTLDRQAADFIRRQPPDARKRIRAALHAIEAGRASPEPLEEELEGFYKVKAEAYRLILKAIAGKRGPGFDVVFAERRSVVYEIFSRILGLE